MRIPPVEAADADKQVQKVYDTLEKAYGTALNPLRTMAYKPQMMRAVMTLYGAIHAPNPNLSEELKELVSIRVSQINGCRHYCVPYHTLQAKKHGATDAKIAAVAQARNSTVLSDLEKLAIEYAERITVPSMVVTDEFFDRLREFLDDADIVELTAVISFMNFWSKTIDALDIPLDEVFAEVAPH
ncbi:carboxymuconolactone decarboxylase family protein [Synechococcus sp. PCC 7336]|uniref:carboxymuconolactone decarboxylase family protein n=1 Tax=Synechococcus sp. PCC 7336 TaxID=195250 RepID=UPI000348A0D8|nr:carboxymuconolactone decarboxylase family protein [Synechococcus sp. PCC 7336]